MLASLLIRALRCHAWVTIPSSTIVTWLLAPLQCSVGYYLGPSRGETKNRTSLGGHRKRVCPHCPIPASAFPLRKPFQVRDPILWQHQCHSVESSDATPMCISRPSNSLAFPLISHFSAVMTHYKKQHLREIIFRWKFTSFENSTKLPKLQHLRYNNYVQLIDHNKSK